MTNKLAKSENVGIEDLRDQLNYGDYKTLADMAKVSRETVKKTLAGSRNNAAVIQAAKILIQSRESAKRAANSIQ